MRWLPSTVHPLSRIGLRLLAFNLLVMFVPVFGVLYLDIYEARLRQAQEAGLVQQARVLAAALGDRPALDDEAIAGMFARLERRSDARFRVYDTRGVLIADSARQAAGTAVDEKARYPASDEGRVRSRMLYRAGAWLAYIRERGAALLRTSSERAADGAAPARRGDVPTEVRAALAGRYGAATRITAGQRSLTMFSAVPVPSPRWPLARSCARSHVSGAGPQRSPNGEDRCRRCFQEPIGRTRSDRWQEPSGNCRAGPTTTSICCSHFPPTCRTN